MCFKCRRLGAVLHYLIRLEPFTTYFLEFQGGKVDHVLFKSTNMQFDHPNRMFSSIPQSWAGTAVDNSSVKELVLVYCILVQLLVKIPEFFYMPEFLQNSNRFNFGLPVKDPAPCDNNGLVAQSIGNVYTNAAYSH